VVNPLSLVKLVQSAPNRYKLDGATALKFAISVETADEKIDAVNKLLDVLAGPGS